MKVDRYSITRFYVLGDTQISTFRGKSRATYDPQIIVSLLTGKVVIADITRKAAADAIKKMKKIG